MKFIVHFFIILVAACAVAAGIYGFTNQQVGLSTAPAAAWNSDHSVDLFPVHQQGGGTGLNIDVHSSGINLRGSGNRLEGGRSGSAGGILGILENLAVIGSIMLVIVVIQKLFLPKMEADSGDQILLKVNKVKGGES